MRRTLLLIALGALLIAGCVGGDRGDGYDVTMLVMPSGHADAGRAAFVELGCSSCHAVSWETELPRPVGAAHAPEIGKSVAATSPGMLVTAIIAPSHYVSPAVRETAEGELSPMGDFTESMTVRQLIDIVAYLKSKGQPDPVAAAQLRDMP